jgi:Universal stress protein family.
MDAPARKFLVVVDKTPECKVAVRFAARRAQHTGGRVSLLCVAPPADFQQWGGVEEIMMAEARETAEAEILAAAEAINDLTGIVPELLIEQGEETDVLLDLIAKDHAISILVVASCAAKDGPGPLVRLFTSKVQAIPVTIVPGNLSDAMVDEIA